MKKLRQRNSNLNRQRRGATAVEFALTLPILFLFLFACYEMGRANMLAHATESAAYEAARVGIVPGAQPEQIRNAAEFVLASVGISDFTIVVSPSVITNQTTKVRVDISVPFRDEQHEHSPNVRWRSHLPRQLRIESGNAVSRIGHRIGSISAAGDVKVQSLPSLAVADLELKWAGGTAE